MKFKGKKRLYQQGGAAWHNELPEVAVRGIAPTRNRYVTASEGHRANTGVIPAYAQRKKTNAEIMAEAKRNTAGSPATSRPSNEEIIAEARRNQAIEREEQALDRQDRINRGARVRTPNIERPGVGNVTPIQGNRPNVPTQPITIPSRRPIVGTPNAGNPQQIANPNVGVEQTTQTTPPWKEPEVSVNPNLAGPDYQNMPRRSGGSNNAGNTRGIGQRALGLIGQTVGGAIDGVLSVPRQIYHGVAKGAHNLNHAAGRVVFGQTGETPAYPEYQHDRTFQTLGRNAGETMGHASDKLLAIPEAGAATLIDGGINLVGRGIHELDYGLGRAVSGGKWVTPEYQPVDPAMSAVGYVRGMPGETYQDRVSNSDTPTYGKLYGAKEGERPNAFIRSLKQSQETQNAAVKKAQDEARVANKKKKEEKAAKKAANSKARNEAIAKRQASKKASGGVFNKIGFNFKAPIFQQGGQMPQDGGITEEELIMDFAVRYLTTMGVDESEIMDPQGSLNEAYIDEITEVLNQDIDWDSYLASPDEYVAQMIMQSNPEMVELARKGAKLRRLKTLRFKTYK